MYSTLLASLPGMPLVYVQHAPPMVLAHARAELKQASKDAQQRALHALMWLGSGGPYERFKGQEKGQQPSEPWSLDRYDTAIAILRKSAKVSAKVCFWLWVPELTILRGTILSRNH